MKSKMSIKMHVWVLAISARDRQASALSSALLPKPAMILFFWRIEGQLQEAYLEQPAETKRCEISCVLDIETIMSPRVSRATYKYWHIHITTRLKSLIDHALYFCLKEACFGEVLSTAL